VTSVASRPVRVLHHYPHTHLDTGSPRALVGLIDLLDRDEYQPLFLAEGDGPLVDTLSGRGVEIVRGDTRSLSFRRPLAALRRIRSQARMLEQFNVHLVHHHEFGWNLDLVLAAWLKRVPVVLQFHNPGRVERHNLHRFAASRVLLVSAAQEMTIGHFKRIQDRSAVLPNPVDIGYYASGRSRRPELGLQDDHVVIGCVAQICHRKGIDLLVEAARRIIPKDPRRVFVVVGPAGKGEEEFSNRMLRAAAEPEFDGRLRFVGSRKEIPDLLATFDLFLLPTRAEPFGMVVTEAMAAGLPVVASRVGGIPSILNSPDLGVLVADLTPDSFARALEGVLELPDSGRAMGSRGKASLTGRFDRDTLRARLQGIYAELVAKRR
jgi:glycosyltransferase involved in cell wall biosynthesis